ncbi:hypothetical protein KR200_002776, partial [Drosophila serrata]
FSTIMCENVIKILIIGDAGVGKSSLVWRYTEDHFTRNYFETTGIELKHCQVEVAGEQVLLHIWDAAGSGRFQDRMQNYYRNCDGVILVYDTTSLRSFRNVDSWLKELADFCSNGVNLMLVGTKYDKLEERQVTKQKASRFASQQGLSHIETSAKSGANVKNIFDTLAVEVYNRLVLSSKEKDNGDGQQGRQDKTDEGDGQGHF